METKTITIILRQTQDTATSRLDTVFTSVVTDRERIRDRAAIKDKKEKVIVRTDTVFVERRDSVEISSPSIQDSGSKRASPFVRSLRWIFALVIAVIVLIVVIKIKW